MRIGCVVVAVVALGCGGDPGGADDVPDASVVPDARPPDPPGGPLDPALLHHVTITIAADLLALFDEDQSAEVPCDIQYDDVVLARSTCRKKGSGGSVDPAVGKPAFAIKLDDLVPGQKLGGLDRLTLNNALQDPSLLHEHIAYQVFRDAGIAAHRTAFATVTLNGVPRGIYVALDPIDKEFLRAHFGAGNDQGNLYESPTADFATEPADMDLKDEAGRSRADLEAAAAAVTGSSDAELATAAGALIDLDEFTRFFAVEIAMAAEDGFAFGRNNYYLYHHPVSDKFVFLPHGQDVVLGDPALEPGYPPTGRLAARFREIPALSAQVDAAITALLADGGAFDLDALDALIDQAVAVVGSTDRVDPFTLGDVAQLTHNAAVVKAQLAYRRQVLLGTAAPPECGDGVVDRGEQCDDGALVPGDGCDADCRPECVTASGGGATWRLCPAARSWSDALAACQAEGGALAVPVDADEAALLWSLMRARFGALGGWLGLTDAVTEGTWLTDGGAAAPYLGFGGTEPNGDVSENCATLDPGLVGRWRDHACDLGYAAICRMP